MSSFVPHLWLLPIGFALGVLGTLVGAGGGFLLVPLLLLVYPSAEPETVTSISLAVVCGNAASGSMAYARMRRIDYRSGLLFAAASVPGAVAGAMLVGWLPRRTFDILFGAMLLIVSALLLHRTRRTTADADRTAASHPDIVNRHGRFPLGRGLAISAGVGLISSLLGVGGGIMHVPALVYLLNFPVHVATATSHFVLAITAGVGTIAHIVAGDFAHGGARRALILALGVIAGAPLGAALSRRIADRWIIRVLGASLGIVGIRLIVLGLA